MEVEEFTLLIQSIGFKTSGILFYDFGKYQIDVWEDHYDFYNGSEWNWKIELYDLTPLKENFNKYFRSIKLKQLLR